MNEYLDTCIAFYHKTKEVEQKAKKANYKPGCVELLTATELVLVELKKLMVAICDYEMAEAS